MELSTQESVCDDMIGYEGWIVTVSVEDMEGSEIIFEVTQSAEGGFEARALGYSIFTQAETHAQLKEMVRDAVRCHFEDESSRPRVIRLHMVQDELISA